MSPTASHRDEEPDRPSEPTPAPQGTTARTGGGSSGRGRLARLTAAGAVTAAAGVMAAGFAVAAVVAGSGSASSLSGGTGWAWYKTDTHVHSVFSGDGNPDLGIIQASGLKNGYDAFFLTDHHMGSNFPISIQTGNTLSLDDNPARWSTTSGGTPSSASSPVATGTVSWKLSGTTAYWTKRAANFRSGAVKLSFNVTAGLKSGFYVSASLGGDPSLPPVTGYTAESGQVLEKFAWVFVWYLGAAPPPPAAGAQVINVDLAPFCGPGPSATWTTCTVPDMKTVLQQIPAAQRPLDYNAFTDVKVGAYGGGSGNLDSFAVTAQSPVSPAQEFAYRNTFLSNARGVLGKWDTPAFRIYAGVENGIGDHVNRFNFGSSDVPTFQPYQNGIQGVPAVQATGYPSQLDHTGLPGGVTDQEARTGVSDKAPKLTEGSYQGVPGFGAELMELNTDNMIANWDTILTSGVVVLGTRSTDNHLGTWSSLSEATYVQAPSLEFDDLMRSMYEGRMFLAVNSWGDNKVIFNPDPAATDAYPSRYPVFVPQSQNSASVHLSIAGGIAAGSSVVWITNGGQSLGSDPAAGPSYDAVKSVPLTGYTYVRAELRKGGSGMQDVMTEPIIFRQVTGLPAGMGFHADGVNTPTGTGYTSAVTKGVTGGAWDGGARTLTLTLENPAGSLVEYQVATGGQTPNRVTSGGAPVPRAASLTDYLGASGPSWFFEAGVIHVKAAQGAGATPSVVGFSSVGGDAAAPSAPAGLSARPAGPTRIDLGWSASTDNVGVAGYNVYRDGIALAQLPAGTTSYSDAAAAPGTTYSYAVDAFDAAGNHSPQSNVVTASIGGPPTPTTTTPTTPTTTTTSTTPEPGSTTTAQPGSTNPDGSGGGGGGPTATGSNLNVTQLVQGAFRAAASVPHQESFDLRTSVTAGKAANEVGRPLPRPLNLRARGEAIVERAGRARATTVMSGLRGRVNLVTFDGKLYVSRDGKRFRTASRRLQGLLPPALPSGLGQSPAALPASLTKVRDMGVKRVRGVSMRHLRAQLSKSALRSYLTGSLVRGGMSGAGARAAVAGGKVRVNRVDLYVANDGRLERETVNVTIALSSGKGKTRSVATASARADVSLSQFGADLTVAKPRSLGIVATLRALANR